MKMKLFILFLQDINYTSATEVVDNFNVTSVHYLLDKICINTNYLEVICFKNLSQSTLFYLSRSQLLSPELEDSINWI
jgi:hypothetical protein